MSVEAMVAVLNHSQAKGGARLLLLVMANEAASDGSLTAYRRSLKHLAKMCNCSVDTVRRQMRELVDLGELTILAAGGGRQQSDYRLDVVQGVATVPTQGSQPCPPRGSNPATPGVATVPPPSSPSVPVLPLPTPAAAAAGGAAEGVVAQSKPEHEVARRVWEGKNPKPAIPFIAVRKIAARFLERGWPPDAIVDAMLEAPTISIGAVELQLNRRRAPTRPPTQDRRVDTNRSAPSGLVEDL